MVLLIDADPRDAINDGIIRAMVVRIRINTGTSSLAYIWFGAVGLTVAGALCYLPLQAPGMVKNILFVARLGHGMLSTPLLNVPYGSMLSVSDDPIACTAVDLAPLVLWAVLLTGMLIPVMRL